MKIALLGDVHGELGFALASLRTAKSSGAELVGQLGDLGAPWPGQLKYAMTDRLSLECERLDLDFLWIRGNHDSWNDLMPLRPEPGEGFARMRERMWYLPDGAVAEVNGVRIAGLGGATSIDRLWRLSEENMGGYKRPRTMFWPEEMVSRGASARLMLTGSVDLLLTHEAPQQVFEEGLLQFRGTPVDPDFEADSQMDIALVTRVRAATQPRLHAHGHHHQRVTSADGSIIGLGRDGDRTGALVLWDSDDGTVTDLVVKGG